MTNHRPAARAALRGLVQLLTDRSPDRRQPRDFIADATRFPHRPWRSKAGGIPDWLAGLLGAAGLVFFLIAFAHEAGKVFR